MGANSSAINPTQDFLARMGGGRLFDMGASTVKYGKNFGILQEYCKRLQVLPDTFVYTATFS